MPSVYQNVDAALVLSRYEAFGYVSLEAMACAKPVLAFNGTGTGEICVHGETALLAPIDDLDTLVGNARRLANDSGLALKLGQNGYRRAAKRFQEYNAIRNYLRIYRRVLATK